MAARLQAHMALPPGFLKQPSDGCRYLWGGRDVQEFQIAVLPEGPSQVIVLAKNVTVQVPEYHPRQD